MKSYNQITLVGCLGADPKAIQVEVPGKGTVEKLSLSLSTSRPSGKDGEKTFWHHISVWKELAASIKPFLAKGSRIMVVGRLEYYKKQVGENQFNIPDIQADEVLLLDWKTENSGQRPRS